MEGEAVVELVEEEGEAGEEDEVAELVAAGDRVAGDVMVEGVPEAVSRVIVPTTTKARPFLMSTKRLLKFVMLSLFSKMYM
jgi:hypothetical protein